MDTSPQDSLRTCFHFLCDLDNELQRRIDGLERSNTEWAALCHRLQSAPLQKEEGEKNQNHHVDTAQNAEVASISGLSLNASTAGKSASSGGDELDNILAKARKIREPVPTTRKQSQYLSNRGKNAGGEKLASGKGSSGSAKPLKSEDELDRILSLARGMRSGGRTDAQPNPDPPMKTAKNDIMNSPAPPRPTESSAEVPKQARFTRLDGRRLEKQYAAPYSTTRTLHCTQSKVLSEGAGEVIFPRSIPYYTLRGSLSPTGIPVAPTTCMLGGMSLEGPPTSSSAASLAENRSKCYLELTRLLKENRKKYMKHMKRLFREGERVSNICEGDRDELLKFWIEHQMLLDLYSILRFDRIEEELLEQNKSIGIDTPGDDLQSALNTIRALPPATPLDLTCPVSQILEPGWVSAVTKEIHAFHDALKTRSYFAAEAIIARTALKECIVSLKHCTSSSRRGLSPDWTSALKLYRSVWNCLSGDLRQEGSVSFVYK